MGKTFSYRRHEGVRDAPMVEAFMARWPALIDFHEINAELKRIATIPPQTKFLAQLDLHLDNLVKLVNTRGELGLILKRIVWIIVKMLMLNVSVSRECVSTWVKTLACLSGSMWAWKNMPSVRLLKTPLFEFIFLKIKLQQMNKSCPCRHQGGEEFG
ncbi:uncharacterized protein LOC143418762 [Maylandia zebra]|uniref:uncharacterized protein LOC143418762 n=1 Tax=Maylandia zebra TaxID=106582 RepID=UPI00403C6925